jgi:hypothetical protein
MLNIAASNYFVILGIIWHTIIEEDEDVTRKSEEKFAQ